MQGPYLVRGASLSPDGQKIELIGDSLNTTVIEVFAPKLVSTISWNGESLKTAKTSYGSLTARLAGPNVEALSLPKLGPWKVQESLPERLLSYDDSGPAWIGKCMLGLEYPLLPCRIL